ncbi:MAG: CRISPR-associated endonuclease Cas3'', partial [Propionivibrio sp.]
MHIVLISACAKKSLKRTRAVLDSYALRAGDAAWMTPITRAGLIELRMLLRRGASRNTAVACYQNDGRKQMKLLWIVGNTRKFGTNGAYPVAIQARRKSPFPAWAKVAALLADSAGHMHDIGKFAEAFQAKLRSPGPKADDVRHEWLSLFVVRQLCDGKSWAQAWATDPDDYRDLRPFDGQLNNALEALWFMIATHHRLPAANAQNPLTGKIGNKAHVRDSSHLPRPVCGPEPATLEIIHHRLAKLGALPTHEDPLYWRALALFARMALILADHSVSAEKHDHPNAPAYANTDRKTGKIKMNQGLDWHLKTVGRVAGSMVFNMLALAPPSLSPDGVARIRRRATGRYAWQESASRALAASADKHDCPHLVFNMAGTGSGKTRMNLRALCELSPGRPVRVATALNLRTLTLQTGDAYAAQIGVDGDEMACVIGDRLTRALYAYNQEAFADDDENPLAEDFSAFGDFEYNDAPPWLAGFLAKSPQSGKIIGAPLLVSTIDFLIAAGEPNRQGHHALAALRLMSSDLILDEIDGYDTLPLMAVVRLIMLAAFFGHNVVVSSGTLSPPVAVAVWRAFRRGIEMRAALYCEKADFVTVAIDDLTAPAIIKADDAEAFKDRYDGQIGKILAALAQGGHYRIPCLQKIEQANLTGFKSAIGEAASKLHAHHHLVDPVTGKRISFGLVRMANINPAVDVAKHLSTALPHARIACYHSQHFPLQRFHIERRLDALLTRKEGDAHLFTDPEVRAAISATEGNDVLFIVVATPVEEIGRDHDFDWAVIEPSSAQSIVQTAGRVNRHRLREIEQPNVAILQFNWKFLKSGGNNSKAAFTKPGLEGPDALYNHDLEKLFDWQTLQHKLDATARLGAHEFARLDDLSLEAATRKWLNFLLGDGNSRQMWMCNDVYR